jgi:hypothetical protein
MVLVLFFVNFFQRFSGGILLGGLFVLAPPGSHQLSAYK